MHVCRYSHLHIHIYFSQHVDLSNIKALCLGGGTRCSGRVSIPASLVTPATSYENVKIGKSLVQ